MPHRRTILQRGVTKALQRYWRLSRGLTLSTAALVIDERSRVLLVRGQGLAAARGTSAATGNAANNDGGRAPREWRLPGGAVGKGEAAAAAISRQLTGPSAAGGLMLELREPPRLIGIRSNFDERPNDHTVLYAVTNWTLPSAGPDAITLQTTSAGAGPRNADAIRSSAPHAPSARFDYGFFAPSALPAEIATFAAAQIAAYVPDGS